MAMFFSPQGTQIIRTFSGLGINYLLSTELARSLQPNRGGVKEKYCSLEADCYNPAISKQTSMRSLPIQSN